MKHFDSLLQKDFQIMSREKVNQKDSERLKYVRSRFNIKSQTDLSGITEVPAHKIKDIESGKVRISVEIASILEEKFNLNFKWILTGKGEMFPEDSSFLTEKSFNVINRNGGIQTIVKGDNMGTISIGVDNALLGEGVNLLTRLAENRTYYFKAVRYMKALAETLNMEKETGRK